LAREGTFAAAGCWLLEDVLLLPTGLQVNKDWLVEYCCSIGLELLLTGLGAEAGGLAEATATPSVKLCAIELCAGLSFWKGSGVTSVPSR